MQIKQKIESYIDTLITKLVFEIDDDVLYSSKRRDFDWHKDKLRISYESKLIELYEQNNEYLTKSEKKELEKMKKEQEYRKLIIGKPGKTRITIIDNTKKQQ